MSKHAPKIWAQVLKDEAEDRAVIAERDRKAQANGQALTTTRSVSTSPRRTVRERRGRPQRLARSRAEFRKKHSRPEVRTPNLKLVGAVCNAPDRDHTITESLNGSGAQPRRCASETTNKRATSSKPNCCTNPCRSPSRKVPPMSDIMTDAKRYALGGLRHAPVKKDKINLDDFPTPPWASRALCEHALDTKSLAGMTCLEPAAGRGFTSRPLAEYFESVTSSDIEDYGYGYSTPAYFLRTDQNGNPVEFRHTRTRASIGSSPTRRFSCCPSLVQRAREVARVGCAMLCRSQVLETKGRWDKIFSVDPPTIYAPFVERVPMIKGKVDNKATTATSYAWLIWTKPISQVIWISSVPSRTDEAGATTICPSRSTRTGSSLAWCSRSRRTSHENAHILPRASGHARRTSRAGAVLVQDRASRPGHVSALWQMVRCDQANREYGRPGQLHLDGRTGRSSPMASAPTATSPNGLATKAATSTI